LLIKGLACVQVSILNEFSVHGEAIVGAVVDGIGITGLGYWAGRRNRLSGGRRAAFGRLCGGLVKGSRPRNWYGGIGDWWERLVYRSGGLG
jgi:hypothetical protein